MHAVLQSNTCTRVEKFLNLDLNRGLDELVIIGSIGMGLRSTKTIIEIGYFNTKFDNLLEKYGAPSEFYETSNNQPRIGEINFGLITRNNQGELSAYPSSAKFHHEQDESGFNCTTSPVVVNLCSPSFEQDSIFSHF